MAHFGWSLPPGCSTLPGEEPEDDRCMFLVWLDRRFNIAIHPTVGRGAGWLRLWNLLYIHWQFLPSVWNIRASLGNPRIPALDYDSLGAVWREVHLGVKRLLIQPPTFFLCIRRDPLETEPEYEQGQFKTLWKWEKKIPRWKR